MIILEIRDESDHYSYSFIFMDVYDRQFRTADYFLIQSYLMGQSMNRSDSLKARQCNQGRLSVRSLQRSGRSSVILQKQTNRSGSKISPYYLQESPRKIFNNNPFPPRNFPKYAKNQEQPVLSLKDDNKMENERVSLKGEDSNYSPEFKQIDRSACDYQLSISKELKQPRVIQKSHSDSHHDITISFSKTKHHLSNPFHDETIISRQNLFKILQDHEDSQIQQNGLGKIWQNDATELSKKMNIIANQQKNMTLGIQGDAYQGERKGMFGKDGNQNILVRNKDKIKLKQMGNQGTPFNDYEYDQTNAGFKGREERLGKKIVLSKNMQQVRDKIALVGEITDSKSQLMKSVSLHNLSQSFRRVRNWEMSPRKSVEKVQISSPFKQLQRQNINSHDKNKNINQNFIIHNTESSEIIKLQTKVIINSPKTPKKRQNPSKLLLFNGNTTYLTETTIKEQIQNRWNREQNKLSHSNGTQASISEVKYKNMASKEEKLFKKSSQLKGKDNKKNSIYVPAEGEQYDLIGLRSPKKIKLQKFKHPSPKTSLQQKLIKTLQKPNNPQTLLSNDSGIFPLSPNKLSKILGQHRHKQDAQSSNFQHTTKIRKQLQQPKKRYRSSQKKLNLQSKLVLF